MIVIKLQGGIGNQMFQYALGRSLQEKLHFDVCFDTSFFSQLDPTLLTSRNIEIDQYNLLDFKTLHSANIILKSDVLSKAKRFLERRLVPYYKNSYFKEGENGFDSNVFKIKNNTFLDGYWQSPMYFSDIESIIKNEFSLKNPLSDSSLHFKDEIWNSSNSVSLHIRRSDYVCQYSSIYHHLDVAYYIQAVQTISDTLNSKYLNLFIFSDDIAWCKEHLHFNFPTTFIENLDSKPYEDLLLMSYCQHNIIANSTFSWWAAWLNKNEKKLVIAPKKWFKNDNPIFTNHLFPSTWKRL